jgi:phosphatidylserine decarboxylase
MEIHLQEVESPHRRIVVRQIAGAIARRIVCWASIGQQLAPGEKFGMIKIGSRTEIVLPRGDLQVIVRMGDQVRAGTTLLARYRTNQLKPDEHRHEGHQQDQPETEAGMDSIAPEKAIG